MIEYVSIDSLKTHPNNPNKHSKEQIDRLAEIIQYQGWRLPIIVSKQSGLIVSGNRDTLGEIYRQESGKDCRWPDQLSLLTH